MRKISFIAQSRYSTPVIATGSNIMFVRGDEQSKAVQEMQSADNPDEIDISEDEDDDEEEEGGDDGEFKNSDTFCII